MASKPWSFSVSFSSARIKERCMQPHLNSGHKYFKRQIVHRLDHLRTRQAAEECLDWSTTEEMTKEWVGAFKTESVKETWPWASESVKGPQQWTSDASHKLRVHHSCSSSSLNSYSPKSGEGDNLCCSVAEFVSSILSLKRQIIQEHVSSLKDSMEEQMPDCIAVSWGKDKSLAEPQISLWEHRSPQAIFTLRSTFSFWHP